MELVNLSMMSQINESISDNAPSSMNPVSTTIVSTDPDVANIPQQITQWVDDTAVQHASLPNPVVPSEDILISGSESREHNIIDVLERPVQLESFDWADTQTFETIIKSYNFPAALISNSNNINYKINYFTFFRAHVVIRFVVNANTFQAGRLLAFFSPFSSDSDIGDRNSLNNFMTSYSIFPRIILDASSGNSGELTIPYVSYFTHYDLVKSLGDLGTVRIVVLNPLQSGSATVSVFARFTNISLEIPTGLPNSLSPPALGLFDKISALLKSGHLKEKDLEKVLPVAQVGEAENKARSGVLSSTLNSIGNFSSMLSSTPIIGKYLTPISWIAKASSQVAAYFGLSKPTNLKSPDFLINVPGHSFTTSDGVDNSIVLGSSCENEIGTRSDLFGSDVDEMDISFIVAHESYLTSFSWSDANTSGVLLSAINVSPGICSAMGVPSAVFKPTAPAFIASMFQYWRGSLKFKIQVTKTAYHSGRLRVAFIPGCSLPIPGTIDYNQGYSEIVDLRTSDEIVLTIPFVSNTIWKPSELISFSQTGSLPSSIGVLSITVLNQLRHPDTVAGTLQCNIWISGGDDLQFSVPDFREYMPALIPPPTMPVAQVLGQFQDVGFNTSMGVTNDMFASRKVSPIEASALSIGEHVQNLRSLTRRFGLVADDQLAASSGKAFKYQTNYFGPSVTYGQPISFIHLSPLDYISWLYRFSRGGTRFKVIIRDSVNIGTLRALNIPGKSGVPSSPIQVNQLNSEWVRSMFSGGAFMHIIHYLLNFISEITVPYFSNTHISLIRGSSGGVVVTSNDDRHSDVYWINTGSTDVKFALFKAAADDFSFGWLVGPPALLVRPQLEVYNLNFSVAETLETETGETYTGVRLFNLAVTPVLSNGTYSIVDASISSISLFVSGGLVDIPITSCKIEVTSSNVYLHIPYATPASINLVTSLAGLQALGTINVEFSGP